MLILRKNSPRMVSDVVASVQNLKGLIRGKHFNSLGFSLHSQGHLRIADGPKIRFEPLYKLPPNRCARFEHLLMRIREHFPGISFDLLEMSIVDFELTIRHIPGCAMSHKHTDLNLFLRSNNSFSK